MEGQESASVNRLTTLKLLIGKKKKCERRAREEKTAKETEKKPINQITFINNAWEQCFMKAIGGIDVLSAESWSDVSRIFVDF